MTFLEFSALVDEQPDGVVLLEGRRSIPTYYAEAASRVAVMLAQHFPKLRFRSGNADGADTAFSNGIAQVDASRLQIVAPYSNHKKSVRYADAIYDSPESLSLVQEKEVAYMTINATPGNKRLIEKRSEKGRLAAKAAYLIRDTMKVAGYSDAFPKPMCGLFYVDLNNPMDGGTGHTIRVCQQEDVPFVFQDSWQQWIK